MEKAVAYIRVSKKEEDIENQKIEIKRYCNYKNLDLIAFFVDEDISGAIECMNRSGFKSMIDFLKNNTEIRNVIFSDLTRLGRNMLDNLKTIRFFLDNNYTIHFVKQEFLNSLNDTNLRNLLFAIFSWFAEYERQMIIERTKIGLEKARSMGKRIGRPLKLNEEKLKEFKKLLETKVSKMSIAKIFNISYPTVYNYIKRLNKK